MAYHTIEERYLMAEAKLERAKAERERIQKKLLPHMKMG